MNSVHVTESNIFNQEPEQNQEVIENSMTASKVNTVYLTNSNTFNQEPEQNQEVIENNMTDSNIVEEPKSEDPGKKREWEPTEEQREQAQAYLAAYPNTTQKETLRRRYGI